MKTETTKDNIVQVLRTFADYLHGLDPEERETYVDDVESMLDDITSNDGFGTEGQDDPRGDQRD